MLNDIPRSNLFISELKMYINYFSKQVAERLPTLTEKHMKYLEEFQKNLHDGIEYYKYLIPELVEETKKYKENMYSELQTLLKELDTTVESYSGKLKINPAT